MLVASEHAKRNTSQRLLVQQGSESLRLQY